MTSPLVELFRELERVEFDPTRLSDPGYVTMQLERRQAIFDRIDRLETAHLDVGTRAALLERIRELQERDQKLAHALEAHRNDLGERLGSLAQGRVATRGYRKAESQPPSTPSGKRIA